MLQQWQQLYKDLQQALDTCHRENSSFIKVVECCFYKSERYWRLLSGQVAVYSFPSTEEEIIFFKSIKPAFTAEIEYYSLLYQNEIFKPEDPPEEEKKYWERERARIEIFFVNNTEFYSYYKSGHKHRDKDWFIRAKNNPVQPVNAKLYDLDVNAATSHDGLVATLLAMERYQHHVSTRIQALNVNGSAA